MFIKAQDVCYLYNKLKALNNLSLEIEEGSFVSIIGPNGSGKSTLSRLLNALYVPKSGKIYIDGLDTSLSENTVEIRKRVGLVFQNPDNQIIGDSVEEDIAFGPENLGLDRKEIERRINNSLEMVSMSDLRNIRPLNLSGGQKQRIAIASVLAMGSKCIVFDESTSMLDPEGRRSILKVMIELKNKGITVVQITHNMDECVNSDKVVVLDKGSVALSGSPYEVFSNREKLEKLGLGIPLIADVGFKIGLEKTVLKPEELAMEIASC